MRIFFSVKHLELIHEFGFFILNRLVINLLCSQSGFHRKVSPALEFTSNSRQVCVFQLEFRQNNNSGKIFCNIICLDNLTLRQESFSRFSLQEIQVLNLSSDKATNAVHSRFERGDLEGQTDRQKKTHFINSSIDPIYKYG